MKVKTKLTIVLLVSCFVVTIFQVTIIGTLFLENQKNNLTIFKTELLDENNRMVEEAANLFFQLVEYKLLEGITRDELLEYIKDVDQVNRAVVVFNFNSQSLLKKHSRPEFEKMMTPSIILKQLGVFRKKNKKDFSVDNFRHFMDSESIITPQKVSYQVYNSLELIIGYGKLMEDIKSRLFFLDRENNNSNKNLLMITSSIIITGILFITIAAIWFTLQSIFRPMNRLIESFDRVGRGELYHQLDVHRNDEIGRMAAAFNQMTEKLNQSVNEIKAANIKLDNHSRTLEGRVDQRTKELSDAVEQLKREIEERKLIESELRIARVEAESANRAKTQCLAKRSHEIRTPMNAVIGMAELVMDTSLTPEQKELITTLKTSAESLLGLLNDILDLSKIEIGKLDIESIDFDLKDTLSIAIKSLSLQASRKQLEIFADISPDIPQTLFGDPNRLRQIITNLLSNAVKFTDSGFILFRVQIDQQERSSANPEEISLLFSISDTGIGIPEEKQIEIFEKFIQTDSSISRKFGGSGMGLTISSQLVQLMGGTIWVLSPGELRDAKIRVTGSTFYFLLPFKIPLKKEKALNIAPMTNPGKTGHTFQEKQYQILVAEDNPINQKLIKRILEKRGFIVDLANNGRETLDKIEKTRFDLVLMDIQMPDVDGIEATLLIREKEKQMGLEEIPIIALTAHAMKGDKERFLEVGMNAYLSKPIKQIELIEEIEKYL